MSNPKTAKIKTKIMINNSKKRIKMRNDYKYLKD